MPTSDFAAHLRPLVDRFVQELEEAFTRAAFDIVQASLGRTDGAAPRAIARPSTRAAAKAGTRRRRGEVDATTDRILRYIEAHPGARGEQIKKSLGLDKAQWLLRIQRLIEAGQVTAKGERRATTYALAGASRDQQSAAPGKRKRSS